MATLAENKPRAFELADYNDVPCVASDIVYEGALVGENGSGFGRPLVALDPFMGIATNKVDNSTGAAGAKNIRVLKRGAVQVPIAGTFVAADVGVAIYASDDDSFTKTSASNTRVGTAIRFIEAGIGVVAFEEYKGV